MEIENKEEIDQEEHIKFQQIGFALSEHNKERYQLQEPFLKRLLLNREQCTKVEQELYSFIYQNWLWCIPVYKHKPGQGVSALVGHRMLDKESIMKQAFDFG